jgi:hypothetical protein
MEETSMETRSRPRHVVGVGALAAWRAAGGRPGNAFVGLSRTAAAARIMAALLLLSVAIPRQASAQQLPSGPSEADAECLAVSPTSQVVVDTWAGPTLRGTLMCLSADNAWLLQGGGLSKLPLDRIHRIRTIADPVWDGAVKGAVIPLILWAVLCRDCQAEPMLKASLTYGLIGLVSDALETHRKTLYESGGRSVSFNWGFRF